MRLEGGFALLAAILTQANGGKAKIEDFMPHRDQQPATIESVFALLKAAKDSNGNA